MKIKRTLDTSHATYDICGLSREQISMLMSHYRYGYMYHTHCHADEGDELYQKLEKALLDDVKEF